MAEKKTDRRVRRTRELLTNALITLLQEKSLHEITVKELCDMADINRGTFYLHYKDINDMIEQLETDILNQYETLLTHYAPSELAQNPYDILYHLLLFTDTYKALFKTLLRPGGDISFLVKIKALFRNTYLDVWSNSKTPHSRKQIEYSYDFLAGGFVGMVESWILSDSPETPEEMAELSTDIMLACFRSLL